MAMSVSQADCKAIARRNLTLWDNGFDGIPENLLINVIVSGAILVAFITMKVISWREQKQQNSMCRNGWITLMYRDAADLIGQVEMQSRRSVYRPTDENMSSFGMLYYSFFKLTNEEILERCGVDALQYIKFLKCSIIYNCINSLLVLLCVLPANFHGYLQRQSSLFVRTTMGNLDFRKSDLLWIHISIAFFLLVAGFSIIRSFSADLVVYERSPWTAKTVLMKEIGLKPITSSRIERYFSAILPEAEIEDIKLVYKYKKIIYISRNLRYAEESLTICKFILQEEGRRVYAKEHFWCCRFWCKCPCDRKLMDGITYYETQICKLRSLLANELSLLGRKILRYAFVTLQNEYMAYQARNMKKTEEVEDDKNWKIVLAPDPENIIWENLSRRGSNLSCKTLFLNTAVFLVAVFLTTPTIILSSSNWNDIMSQLNKKGAIARFIPTLLAWLISVAIPALVAYSSGFLDFETKSALNRSIMIKTVIFLIFSVVILPSLGLASISAFFIWTIQTPDIEYKWGCIFLPDNGSFFVSYVMTSAFIGNIIQLLRIGEVLLCGFGVLTAKSEAEKIVIKKSCIWDFNYGIQYSYSLLIFTLVLLFSIMCPVIAPFGLTYFVLKLFVDRYNMYFSCSPSRASSQVHSLAIQFMMFAVILKNAGLFLLMYVRAGWSLVSYVFLAMVLLTLITYIVSMNPFCLKFMPKSLLMPHKAYKEFKEEEKEDDRDVYQPHVLLYCTDLITPQDKYGNPLYSEDSSLDGIESRDFLESFCIAD